MQGIDKLPQQVYKEIYDSMTFNKEGIVYLWEKDLDIKRQIVQNCALNQYPKLL